MCCFLCLVWQAELLKDSMLLDFYGWGHEELQLAMDSPTLRGHVVKPSKQALQSAMQPKHASKG